MGGQLHTVPRGAERYGAWWDERAANAACAFFPRYLRHIEAEWAGQPFRLASWQAERIVRPLFGWKREDGTRLIRSVWLEVPRKNGKTSLAAGLSLLAMLGDGEFGSQAYSIAKNMPQARIVFEKAGTMAASSPELAGRIEVLKNALYCGQIHASFKPLSSGPRGKHGFSPTFAIGDEVHEWEDGGELADVVHKGTAARKQPIEFYITTAGVANQGYAWEMHELALQTLSGDVIDPTFLPVIFAAPDGADWQDEETWRIANPAYNISVKSEYMRAEAEKARRSPRAENDFKRYHLNIWTEQATRWLPTGDQGWSGCTEFSGKEYWKALPELMRGRACHGALDLSLTSDLTSLCWAFPPSGQWKRWVFVWRFWLPRDTVEDQPQARKARYKSFADMGALTLTSGNIVDFDVVGQAVREDAAMFRPSWIGVDRYNASQLAMNLRDQDGLPIEWFGQGYRSMSPASKQFERLVIGCQMEHGSNPVATWMARNVAVERDAAGNIKPTKVRSADKIDGIVTAVMAYGGAVLGDGGVPEVSVYEKRGLLVLQ